MRNPEPIHVAFCSDAGYIPQLAAALVSLFLSNWRNELKLYIVTTGLTRENRLTLEQLSVTFGRNLDFFDLDDTPLTGLAEYVQPKSTYYRLLLPNLLSDVDRLIYLDCDLVVEIDLRELWETKQDNYLVLGVAERDELQPGLQAHVSTPGDPYINAGVIVMDLEAWRREGIASKCLTWLKENPTIATMMDQDAINRVCVGRKGYVPLKWNLNPIHGPARLTLPQFPQRILHFAGPLKPWHSWYCQDLSDIFFKYLRMSNTNFVVNQQQPTKLGQHLSVANQQWERQNYEVAVTHYATVLNNIISNTEIKGNILAFCFENGKRLMIGRRYDEACEIFREILKHWQLPIEHTDIYKIPFIR